MEICIYCRERVNRNRLPLHQKHCVNYRRAKAAGKLFPDGTTLRGKQSVQAQEVGQEKVVSKSAKGKTKAKG